jgi:hypothetical protein
MYSYLPLSDLSVKILDLYMNIDMSVNMSFLSVNIADLSEHITPAHEHIRPVCEHIRLVSEHINCHINLPIHPSMPVLSLCLLFMFVASFAFIISLIYSVIFSLNPAVNKICTRPLANTSISIFGRIKYVLNSRILASNFGFETSPSYSMLIDSSTKDRKALM